MAQLVKHLAFDFSSGHDLKVLEHGACLGFLSPSLSASALLTHVRMRALSLSLTFFLMFKVYK